MSVFKVETSSLAKLEKRVEALEKEMERLKKGESKPSGETEFSDTDSEENVKILGDEYCTIV